MFSSYFSLMIWERFLLLVEIFVGDLLHCSITSTESTPLYGFLVWYYQFIRAESYISIGIFFIILTIIVVLWWCSSYRHEEESFELFTVVFPNESIEWWYDEMIENMLLATFFIYTSFSDLYYYWTPQLPFLFVGGSKTTFPRYTVGLRSHNLFSKLFSSRYHYKAEGYPTDYGALEGWLLDEWGTFRSLKSVRKNRTFNGLGYYRYNNRRSTIGEKLRYFFFVTLSQAMNRRSRFKGWPPHLWRVTDAFPKSKKSRYVRYEFFLDRIPSRFYYRKLKWGRAHNFKFRKRSVAWDRHIKRLKRRRWILRMIFYFNRYLGNVKRLNADRNGAHPGPGRGAEFVRYHYFVRRYRNLVPAQKFMQCLIWRKRKRESLNMLHIRRYGTWQDRILRDIPMLREFFFGTDRPKWHAPYFRQYWRFPPDEAGRGVDYTHYAALSWKIWPYFIALALINGFCWEEDEIEMYEEEFEDWYLELDLTSGELNYGSYDYNDDIDFRSLVEEETEEQAARHHAESRQADIDNEVADRDMDNAMSEHFTEDDLINDPDLALFAVDMYGKIFEYYEDPVHHALEVLQMDMIIGYDMPPAWGRLEEAGAFNRTFLDRIDNLIYAFYNHGFVSVETGRAVHDRWWDGAIKSWRHDGTSLAYLIHIGGQIKMMLDWYVDEYCQNKKEFDPDVYDKMQEMDREIRTKRPHYHGMAIWRGYGGYKTSINPYNLEEAKETLSPEEYEELVQYDLEVTRRELRDEFVHPEEYHRRFPHHRKVIRRDPKTL